MWQHVVTVFVHRARTLSCPGWDLKGVKLLQSHNDAKEIHTSSQGHRVVVIGASFIGDRILSTQQNETRFRVFVVMLPVLHMTGVFFVTTLGMEVASYLSKEAASVAVVGTDTYPYERSLGPEIGKMCMQVRWRKSVSVVAQCFFLLVHYLSIKWNKLKTVFFFFSFKMLEEKNVKFYMNDGVTEVKGENGKVALFLYLFFNNTHFDLLWMESTVVTHWLVYFQVFQ